MRTYAYHDARAAVDVGVTVAGQGVSAATAGSMGATKGAVAVSKLLSAAGASVSAPVAGWIAAGTLVAISGIIAFVGAAKRKTLKVNQVIELGNLYGFPQAAAFPDFILDTLDSGPYWRRRQADKLEKNIAKGKGKTWIDSAKLQFLGIVEAMHQADVREAAGLPPVAPTAGMVDELMHKSAKMQAAVATHKQTRTMLLVGAGAVALISVFLLMKPKKR